MEAMRVRINPEWQHRLAQRKERLLEKVGDDLLPEARRRCPVDTGRLRDSLDFEIHGDVLELGSRDVEYCQDVELGTSHQAPEPFLRPTLFAPHHIQDMR